MRRRRHEAQPQGIKTFGSTFKNPEDPRARGAQRRAAARRGRLQRPRGRRRALRAQARQLHREHRRGDAPPTCSRVMAEGRRRVLERFGVELEPEVQTLGDVRFPWADADAGSAVGVRRARSKRCGDGAPLAGRSAIGLLTRPFEPRPADGPARPHGPLAQAARAARALAWRAAGALGRAVDRVAVVVGAPFAAVWARRRLRIALAVALVVLAVLARRLPVLRHSSLRRRRAGSRQRRARRRGARDRRRARERRAQDEHARRQRARAARRRGRASRWSARLHASPELPARAAHHGRRAASGRRARERRRAHRRRRRRRRARTGAAVRLAADAAGAVPARAGAARERTRRCSPRSPCSAPPRARSPRRSRASGATAKGLTVTMQGGLQAIFGDASRPRAKWLSLAARARGPELGRAPPTSTCACPSRPAAGFAGGQAPASTSASAGGEAARSGTAERSEATVGDARRRGSPRTRPRPRAAGAEQSQEAGAGEGSRDVRRIVAPAVPREAGAEARSAGDRRGRLSTPSSST